MTEPRAKGGRTSSAPTNRFLLFKFIRSLFTGNLVKLPASGIPVGAMAGWSKEGLEQVIRVAVAQIDGQHAALDRTLSRAQVLLTTLLALAAIAIGTGPNIWNGRAGQWNEWPARIALLAAGLFLLLALVGTVAVIAVRKSFDGMHAALLSQQSEYSLHQTAKEYAECVDAGDVTANAHLSVFGTTVRLTLVGSLLLALGWGLANFPVT